MKGDNLKEQERTKLHNTIWRIANELRGSVDGWDFKAYVLGFLFYRFISENLVNYLNAEERKTGVADFNYAELSDDQAEFGREDTVNDKGFYILPSELFENVRKRAKNDESLNETLSKIFRNIEQSAKGFDSEDDFRGLFDDLDVNSNKLGPTVTRRNERLVKLMNAIGELELGKFEDNTIDAFGDAYEYLMTMYAGNAGKSGGEFFTPQEVSELLAKITVVGKTSVNKVYDPAAGSGGMFVWSEKFVEERAGRVSDIAVYGQELNETTWRLAKMNMAIRGIDANIKRGDTLMDDQLPDLKADYILANPPFNISDWGQEHLQTDPRWKYGLPPKGNANFAWIQHMIHHLSPHGTAGFVLANGSMGSQTGGEGDIRKQLVLNDMVDAIVTLPSQLFFNVAIPCCLWFVSRDRANRRGKVLFIDGRNLGKMVTRRNRELTEEDIARIAKTYHDYKTVSADYADQPGFCKVANLEEIKQHDYVLTPGRYVGVEEAEEDDEPFAEKFARLTAVLEGQFAKSHELEAKIKENLAKIEKEIK